MEGTHVHLTSLGATALRSTLIASQFPIEKWHKIIGAPILDRLAHNAHKLSLKGDSLRK